jgi:hypothetical protein
MFNYATYNGVPIITYGLIGLTASILGLLTMKPDILEPKENGEQTTVSEAIGLDKISMPEFPSYLPGLNGLPQPFSNEDEEEQDEEEQSSVFNPLQQTEPPIGGRKTRKKRIKKK